LPARFGHEGRLDYYMNHYIEFHQVVDCASQLSPLIAVACRATTRATLKESSSGMGINVQDVR
jgi:hypothetical protein